MAQAAAVEWIQSLVQELLHATDVAKKKRKKKSYNSILLCIFYHIKNKCLGVPIVAQQK